MSQQKVYDITFKHLPFLNLTKENPVHFSTRLFFPKFEITSSPSLNLSVASYIICISVFFSPGDLSLLLLDYSYGRIL